MTKRRYKQMSVAEFTAVAQGNWVPYNVTEAPRPEWTRNIPEERVSLILASGSWIPAQVVNDYGRTFSEVIGGIDLYRSDEQDAAKGYKYNKDHYIVMRHPTNDERLLIDGPNKDDEHWINELPEDSEIEVLEWCISSQSNG